MTFNIQDYGAVPNSQAAASGNVTAMRAAIGAAIAYGGGQIYLPNGTWFINEVVGITSICGIDVVGAGSGSTTIVQLARNTGVFLAVQLGDSTITNFRDFNFTQNSGVVSDASGLKIVNSVAGANPGINTTIARVSCNQPGVAWNAFMRGIEILGMRTAVIDTFGYCGDNTDNGTTAIYVGNSPPRICVGVTITNCNINLCHCGIEFHNDGTPTGMQGFIVSNSSIVTGFSYGIKSDYCIGLQVVACDIDAKLAIFSTDTFDGAFAPVYPVDQMLVNGCLIYSVRGDGSKGVSGSFSRGTVTGCCFISEDTTPNGVGVEIGGLTEGMTVNGNTFYRYTKSYISALVGSKFNIAAMNVATRGGAASAVNPYQNLGTNNTFSTNAHD